MRHFDHLNPSTAKEFIRRGHVIYLGEEVFKEITEEKPSHGEYRPLLLHNRNKVGGFSVQPFKAPHNVLNYGFLITTPTKERILFLTDTTGVNYRFKDLDCIMVECNHDDETLLENLDRHEVSMSHPEYHMGLNTCMEFCRQNISASTKQIILIHMSSANINPCKAVEEVSNAINNDAIKVDFAEKGKKFLVESVFF